MAGRIDVCEYRNCSRPKWAANPSGDPVFCIFHTPIEEKRGNTDDFWEAFVNEFDGRMREYDDGNVSTPFDCVGFIFPLIPRLFPNRTFPFPANFSSAVFTGGANLDGFTFRRSVAFSNAVFENTFNLKYCEFESRVNFNNCIFEGDFVSASAYPEDVIFTNAKFGSVADFAGVKFKGSTDFKGADFRGEVDFSDAVFKEDADFSFSVFNRTVVYTNATFENEVNFTRAEIKGVAHFLERSKFRANEVQRVIEFHEYRVRFRRGF
jgi:hypothetical protein